METIDNALKNIEETLHANYLYTELKRANTLNLCLQKTNYALQG